MKKAKEKLNSALLRLEEARQRILKSNGYCQDAKMVSLLIEIIKEQEKNEDTGHTARASG